MSLPHSIGTDTGLNLFHYTTQAGRDAGIELTILAEALACYARRRGLETFLLTGTTSTTKAR